ncbi:MAG: glycosyltransferase family 2 protein [Rhizobiaceae bacterium]
MSASVDVVFVTYNSEAVIGDAIKDLGSGLNIIIVDNASRADVGEFVDTDRVTLVRNSVNLGFGTACNIGAARGTAPFILFLNPDTRTDEKTILEMIGKADAHPQGGAFNPLLVNERGSRGRPVKSPICGPYFEEDRANGDARVPFLSGAALLIRRDLFEKIGGFDEKIFLFYEDDDLSYRVTRAGMDLILLRSVRLMHKGGSSSGASLAVEEKKQFWWIRSQRHIARKHGLAFNTPRKLLSALLRQLVLMVRNDKVGLARNRGRIKGLIASDEAAKGMR